MSADVQRGECGRGPGANRACLAQVCAAADSVGCDQHGERLHAMVTGEPYTAPAAAWVCHT